MSSAARRGRPAAVAAWAAVACLVCVLCPSCRGRSERDRVADVLDELARRVEDRDADGLAALLADDYSDFAGRGRDETREMAEDYFRRYRGIKTRMLSARIAMEEAGTAGAEIDVSLYSGVGAALRKAVGFSGENYRVTCRLRKNGSWRIREARWEYIPQSGLFPESLEVLREMFPES